MAVTKLVDIERIMEKARNAAAVFSQLSQEHTDRIVRAVYEAAFNDRVRLSKMAAEETGMGKWQDKVLKTVLATQIAYEDIKDRKTVGILSENTVKGITKIAQPVGPILAFVPVTSPTSAIIFKILVAMKTRNPVIISSNARAMKCGEEAARICYEAALREDAPEDCVQWVSLSREQRRSFMGHKNVRLIHATGVRKIVEEAYSSGTPALGVTAGNVPVFIEDSADVPFAVNEIMLSKTFDNGTIGASEQAVVVMHEKVREIIKEFKQLGGHVLTREEVKKLGEIAVDRQKRTTSVQVLGQPASVIAERAGIDVPEGVKLLIAPLEEVGPHVPLSGQVLAPILGLYTIHNFDSAVNLCIDLISHGGAGHTASIFSNDDEKVMRFAAIMNTGRVLVNTPSSHGSLGFMYNMLTPSMSPGCGTAAKTTTTDNISVEHYLNIQRIARRRVDGRWEHFDMNEYFDETLDAKTLEKEFNRDF